MADYYRIFDQQIAALIAVNPATGDQTTAYIYGTTLTESGVARNDLLRYILYPDAEEIWPSLSVDGWSSMTVDDWANLEITSTDSVSYTYNRLGQQATITDQRGTVRSLYYDKLGRLTNDCVSTVGDDTDDTVLQIATSYEVRGMVQSVTSLDNATPGSGTVLNQCALTYNTFSQLIEEQQEHSGTVTTSSVSVGYAYATATPNNIRLVNLTYPNGRIIGYNYGPAGGMNDYLNRVQAIQSDGSDIAQYDYLGLGTVARITYPEPGMWLDLWGGTSGTFNGIDQFGRIIDQRWQNSITTTPTDIDRYQYGYDQNSNRLWKANVVGTPIVPGGLDEAYTYDTLNRLTDMQRGTLSSGTISGTPSVEQTWTLDALGNWPTYTTAADGTINLSQTRSANTVNEITAIASTPTWATPPAYDPAGNMTSFPQPCNPSNSYTAIYDAWNRMVSASDTGGCVGSYGYDGRSRRIAKVTSSETRHFYWTNSWQNIEERVDVASTMDRQYVWGVRYIDELVCRDDVTSERVFVSQDANFNLTSTANTGGSVMQRFLYDPYDHSDVFGALWETTADVFVWTYKFTGVKFDPESAVNYFRNRYFHASVGRFLSRDRLATYSIYPYEYAASQPINFRDPLGLDTVSEYFDPPDNTFGTVIKYPDDPQMEATLGQFGCPGDKNCYIRFRCHNGIPHCGVEIYNGGKPITVNRTVGLTNVGKQQFAVAAIDGVGPGANCTKIGFLWDAIAPGCSSGYPPARLWLHAPHDDWDTGIYGLWIKLDQAKCNCMINQQRIDSMTVNNQIAYHARQSNSNWILHCLFKRCNIDPTQFGGFLSTGFPSGLAPIFDPPPGWDYGAQCP